MAEVEMEVPIEYEGGASHPIHTLIDTVLEPMDPLAVIPGGTHPAERDDS